MEEYRPGTIKTFTGIYVDPLDLSPGDIRLADICHSLARIGRYGGHFPVFRSVAQHSLEVADYVWHKTNDRQLTRTAMAHDFSEAYVGDMVNPLKRQPAMKEFVRAEDRIQESIAKAFDLVYPFPHIVEEADRWNGEFERSLWNTGRTRIFPVEDQEQVELDLLTSFTLMMD